MTTAHAKTHIIADLLFRPIADTLIMEVVDVSQCMIVFSIVRDPDVIIPALEVEVWVHAGLELVDIQDSFTADVEFTLVDLAVLGIGILWF
jgi:hypothetical protein